MNGVHIIETQWFNAINVLPDSPRLVLVVFKHYVGGREGYHKRIATGRLMTSRQFHWSIDSKVWNPSFDKVTQWAEIEVKRGGCMPDDFPSRPPLPTHISNLQTIEKA